MSNYQYSVLSVFQTDNAFVLAKYFVLSTNEFDEYALNAHFTLSSTWGTGEMSTNLDKLLTYTDIESLTKIFMYGNYIKARSLAENKSITELVKDELSHYPYNRKRMFQVHCLSKNN